MPEVQDPENNSPDSRWIALRVSKINLAITLAGALLAFPLMIFMRELPVWLRVAVLVGLVLAVAWDLRLILLKARDSVGAFYLFDLDPPSPPALSDGLSDEKGAVATSPKLGIRLRYAKPAKRKPLPDRDGIVLGGAFVSPWFTALRYQLPGDAAWRRLWPRVIPLWSDSLAADEFRKTRVALKWK